MADHPASNGSEAAPNAPPERTDRGCFDFFKKKDEEQPVKDVTMADAGRAQEEKKSEQKATLKEKVHCSDSSSSSSSDEEGGGEKKKKKGLKKKIKEKISGEKEEGEGPKDTPMETAESTNPEEKKGFLDKTKEKLPGQHKNAEEGAAAHAEAVCAADGHHYAGGKAKEKKVILEKIKDKMPGGHHKIEDEDKDK